MSNFTGATVMRKIICWVCIVLGLVIAAVALHFADKSKVVATIISTLALGLVVNGIWQLLGTTDPPAPPVVSPPTTLTETQTPQITSPPAQRVVAAIISTLALGLVVNGIWQLLGTTDPPAPPVVSPLTTLMETQTPQITSPPMQGESTTGTMLRNVQYNDSGKIVSATEKIENTWVSWKYIYSESGSFLYRIRNIGNVYSTLTSKFMSGKETTYSILDEQIENCVGFTLSYCVSELRKGNYKGEREVYVSQNTSSWELVGTFEYESQNTVKVTFSFDSPISFIAFATPRTHPDNSSFGVNQSILDVWVADYEYVEVAS